MAVGRRRQGFQRQHVARGLAQAAFDQFCHATTLVGRFQVGLERIEILRPALFLIDDPCHVLEGRNDKTRLPENAD